MANYCAFCSEKQGMLSSYAVTKDGSVICSKCAEERDLVETVSYGGGSSTQINRELIASLTLEEARHYVDEGKEKARQKLNNIVITTADLHFDYEVISPIFFQISNKGVFSSDFSKLREQYHRQLKNKKAIIGDSHLDLSVLWGQGMVSQALWSDAFYISLEEMKKRAVLIGADAIVGMKMDIDLDTNALQFFYMQMYGTAVRYKKTKASVQG